MLTLLCFVGLCVGLVSRRVCYLTQRGVNLGTNTHHATNYIISLSYTYRYSVIKISEIDKIVSSMSSHMLFLHKVNPTDTTNAQPKFPSTNHQPILCKHNITLHTCTGVSYWVAPRTPIS